MKKIFSRCVKCFPVFLLFLISDRAVFSQSSVGSEVKSKAPDKGSQREISSNIFNPSIKKLSPTFIGNDMTAMLEKVVANNIKPKDEYETSLSYINRYNLSIAQSMRLKGRWNNNSCFVTVSKYQFIPSYEADSQQLMLGMPRRFVPMGRTIEGADLRELYMSNGENLAYVGRPLGLKMTPSQAKKVRGNLGFLVAFTSPINENGNRYSPIRITVKHFWIFNIQTGEIYKKLTPTSSTN